MREHPRSRRYPGATAGLVALVTAVILLAGFVVARYGGLWGETDSNVFAAAMRAMLTEARLIPSQRVYPNGYGFLALGTFLVHLSGLSVAQLQIFGGALLAVWIVLPAWLAYRALTSSTRAATLATVIILIQPEFLFPILRGSHEKFTRGFMFLAIYLLVNTFVSRRGGRHFAASVLALYFTIYALITFNNLLATSFIAALLLTLFSSLVIYQTANRAPEPQTDTRRRLLYTVTISLLLAFVFTFYAYPPARYSLLLIESVVDRLALLFLALESTAVNPYQAVVEGWISLPVYLLVSLANWLLLGFSFILWSTQTVRWWRQKAWQMEPRPFLLWSLYGAFGFMGAFSIVVDYSGAISSNLQHRIFPSFAMIAAALVADWFIRRRSVQRVGFSRFSYVALAVGLAFLSIMAVVKATNEPALSNKWLYYVPAEFTALDWARTVNADAPIWTEFDERLRAAIGICCDWEAEGMQLDSFRPTLGTRVYLISDVSRSRSGRLGLPLPIEGDSLQVYDNGDAQIFRLRPRTPFQR